MQLTPNIQLDLGSPVWRMKIDETSGILCVETRDVENHTTAFTSIDLNTGAVYFKGLQLPYGWQCGLDTAAFGVMLVHGFQSETMPVRKGLTAIDAKTGNTLWDNYNWNLERIHSVGFEVFDVRIQPKKIFLVSAKTGQVVTPHVKSSVTESSILYPDVLDGQALELTGLEIEAYANTAHFLSHNGYRIVSLHALSGGILNQHLYVYDTAVRLVFEDILARAIQKLQPEAFIIFDNKLIWLQNRSVIKVLPL